jgi:hypothetical protein
MTTPSGTGQYVVTAFLPTAEGESRVSATVGSGGGGGGAKEGAAQAAAEAAARHWYFEFDWAGWPVVGSRPARVTVEQQLEGTELVLDLGTYPAPHEEDPRPG